MAGKKAISYNGSDSILGDIPVLSASGGTCSVPVSDCVFVDVPPPPSQISNVKVNGYDMAAQDMTFGELVKSGTGCPDTDDFCTVDIEVSIPEDTCSTRVFVNGKGAALPGIEFDASSTYKTEITGGANNVLIY